MVGYATNETPELMPLPITLAHKIARGLAEVRKGDVLPYLRPDGKTQVTIRYEVDEHGHQRPVEIERSSISTQHREGVDPETQIKPDLIEHVLAPLLPHGLYDERRLRRPRLPLRQPDRQVRDRRPDGRRRAHRPQDHRRHLRRRRPARRRRLLGQGPDQGRPLGRLRGALRREERRRRRARRPLPAPGRLRDRRRPPVLDPRRLLRDRTRSTSTRIEELVREHFDLRPAAILRDLDLRRPIYAQDRRLRPLRPRRPRLHLGARPTRSAALRAAPPASASRAGASASRSARADEEAGGGLLADRRVGAVEADAQLARGRLGRVELDVGARARAPGRRTSAAARRRARRGGRSSRARPARAPTAAPARGSRPARRRCRSASRAGSARGCRAARWIRSTMSSLKVSPSSSACTCASAAV